MSNQEFEVEIAETDLLRAQLQHERVASAKEALNSATLLHQLRQAELEGLLSMLAHRYRPTGAESDLEIKAFNLQKKTLIFGPVVASPGEKQEQ